MDEHEKRAYLAAFIDGEGHVGQHPNSNGWTREISFTNTDKQLFDQVVQIATELGFHFRIHHRQKRKENWSDTWVAQLSCSKSIYERFRDMIPLQAVRKQKALETLINGYSDNSYRTKTINRISLTCAACGQTFEEWPSNVNRGRGKFCSKICSAQKRMKPVIAKVCEYCGNAYAISHARAKRSRFCGASCRDLAQGKRISALAGIGARTRWRR